MVKKKIVDSHDTIDIDECITLYVYNNNNIYDNDTITYNNYNDNFELNISNDNDNSRILFGSTLLRKALNSIQRNVTHIIVHRVAIFAATTFYNGFNKRKCFMSWLNKARLAAYYIKALEKRCLLRRGLLTLRSRVTITKSNWLRRKHLLSSTIKTWKKYVIDTINDASPMMSSTQVYATFKWMSFCYKSEEPTYHYAWINTYATTINVENDINNSFNNNDDSGDLLNLSVYSTYSNPAFNTTATNHNITNRVRTYLMGHLFLPSFKYPLLLHSLALLDVYMQRYLFSLWKERVMKLLTFRKKIMINRVNNLLRKWVDHMDILGHRKTHRRMIVKRIIMNGLSAKYLMDIKKNNNTNSYDTFTFQPNYYHIYKCAIPRMRLYRHAVFEQNMKKHISLKFFIYKKMESSWNKWNHANSNRNSHKIQMIFANHHRKFKMLKNYFEIFWNHHINVCISNNAYNKSKTIIKNYRNMTMNDINNRIIVSILKANKIFLIWVNRKIFSKVNKKHIRMGYHHDKVTSLNKAFNSMKTIITRLTAVKEAVFDRYYSQFKHLY